jgi:hypothetical protein
MLKVPYFFGYHATRFEDVHYLLSLGVQQIYITESLGFDIVKVAALCKQKGVLIRVYPNVAQSYLEFDQGLKRFFLRPEDIKFYEPYIDIIEFWGPAERQDILYKIYSKGTWLQDISPIILNLDINIDNAVFPPYWATARSQCGLRCMKGFPCEICDHTLTIWQTLLKTKEE